MSKVTAVGVVLSRSKSGKYICERVELVGNKVTRRVIVSMGDRTLQWAHKDAEDDMRVVLTDLSRGNVELEDPAPGKLFKGIE